MLKSWKVRGETDLVQALPAGDERVVVPTEVALRLLLDHPGPGGTDLLIVRLQSSPRELRLELCKLSLTREPCVKDRMDCLN